MLVGRPDVVGGHIVPDVGGCLPCEPWRARSCRLASSDARGMRGM